MFIYSLLKRFRPEFQAIELEELIVPFSKTVLDLGCGNNSNLIFFRDKIDYSVGVDLYKKYIDESKRRKIHDKYIFDDVNNIDKYFGRESFDAVIAIGLVEHLIREKALNLISKMESLARKIVIIGTPNGFLKQEEYDENVFQVHHSGFVENDFKKLGYQVYGMDGPKFLRGEKGKIKYFPVTFFAVIANILDPLLRHYPKFCFNLLAFKKIEK